MIMIYANHIDTAIARGWGNKEMAFAFFNLPVELVFKILRFCDGSDIVNLEEAADGLDITHITGHDRLWQRVSLSPPSGYKRCKKYLGSHTRSLHITGSRLSCQLPNTAENQTRLSELYMSRICLQVRQLTHLTLENTLIDSRFISEVLIPATVMFLRLSNIVLTKYKPYKPDDLDRELMSSPFYSIKNKSLKKLEICESTFSFLSALDTLTIFLVKNEQVKTDLRIEGKTLHFTFEHIDSEHNRSLKKCIEREVEKKQKFVSVFHDLIDFHMANPIDYIRLYNNVVYKKDVFYNNRTQRNVIPESSIVPFESIYPGISFFNL